MDCIIIRPFVIYVRVYVWLHCCVEKALWKRRKKGFGRANPSPFSAALYRRLS
jgi:hypothetical protein